MNFKNLKVLEFFEVYFEYQMGFGLGESVFFFLESFILEFFRVVSFFSLFFMLVLYLGFYMQR